MSAVLSASRDWPERACQPRPLVRADPDKRLLLRQKALPRSAKLEATLTHLPGRPAPMTEFGGAPQAPTSGIGRPGAHYLRCPLSLHRSETARGPQRQSPAPSPNSGNFDPPKGCAPELPDLCSSKPRTKTPPADAYRRIWLLHPPPPPPPSGARGGPPRRCHARR